MYQRMRNDKYYRRFYFQDSFYVQCQDIDSLSLIQFDRSVEQVKKIICHPVFKRAKKIIAAGCGDSNISSFAVKGAFEYYLPDVEYKGVEAIELSRHYDFEENESDTVALFVSKSGYVLRTIEALEQCRRHGVTTVAVTDGKDSETAKKADILYYENTPKGDNNAGLRTYYVSIISLIILAAAMAEIRTGESKLEELKVQVIKYHDAFFREFEKISDFCFITAIHWMDKEYFSFIADGPLFWSGKFIQAKMAELSGDVCAVSDSENYRNTNYMMGSEGKVGEIILLNSYETNISQVTEIANAMIKTGKREVILFSDREPKELDISEYVQYCHVPFPEEKWNFLAPLYVYLPGAIFAGFRHTTIGEPMFRGGFDPLIFAPTYYSPIDI